MIIITIIIRAKTASSQESKILKQSGEHTHSTCWKNEGKWLESNDNYSQQYYTVIFESC